MGLSAAFDDYMTPIVLQVKDAQNEAEMQELVSRQHGTWRSKSYSPEIPEFMLPDSHEHSNPGRSSLGDYERHKRQHGGFEALNGRPSRGHDENHYSLQDDEEEEDDLGMAA